MYLSAGTCYLWICSRRAKIAYIICKLVFTSIIKQEEDIGLSVRQAMFVVWWSNKWSLWRKGYRNSFGTVGRCISTPQCEQSLQVVSSNYWLQLKCSFGINLISVSVLSRFYEKAPPSRWHDAATSIRGFAHQFEHEWARRLLPITVFLHAWRAVLAKYVSEGKIFRTKVVGNSIDIRLAIVQVVRVTL